MTVSSMLDHINASLMPVFTCLVPSILYTKANGNVVHCTFMWTSFLTCKLFFISSSV